MGGFNRLQGQFDFFAREAMGGGEGLKTNLNKKKGDQGNFFFFYNLCLENFFSNGRVRQEGGMIQANYKNSGRVGT